MLIGKYFPQNIRALRMLLEEVIGATLENIHSVEELTVRLTKVAANSHTAKLWIDGFVGPMLIIFLYIRAEREGEWALYLASVEKMLPYFFASGHHNYARYATLYYNNMLGLPEEVTKKFRKGLHVVRNAPGIFNGIWSDMSIETTYMKFGSSPGAQVV